MYAGVPCHFEISNYEYSKRVIAALIENYNDNVPERIRLLEENKTANPKKVKENNRVIMQIEDCAKAMQHATFETPFGVVRIKNGKLINQNGQVFELCELDKYGDVNGQIGLVQPTGLTPNNGKGSGGRV